jgi:hypothetical protein
LAWLEENKGIQAIILARKLWWNNFTD